MPLLAPVLAQLITLSAGDRTEGRAIISDQSYSEASTRPIVAVDSRWKHTVLHLAYSPSLTLTPLESKPRTLAVFHAVSLVGTYQLRHTLMQVGESVGYGEQNFRDLALTDPRFPTVGGGAGAGAVNGGAPQIGTVLGGPPASGGTGSSGASTPTQLAALTNRSVKYESFTTTAAVTNMVSGAVQVGGQLEYSEAGAVGSKDAALYPRVQGPRALTFVRYATTRQDNFTSTAAVQYFAASTGNTGWVGSVGEAWLHRFDARTSTSLGAGVSGTRTPVLNDGTVVNYSIYPTFNAAITHSTFLARGALGLNLSVASAPALDLITLTVDPRVAISGAAGWSRRRFFSSASIGSNLSVASQGSAGAFRSVNGGVSAGYALAAFASIDTGVRVAWQTYQGAAGTQGTTTVVPLSYAGFVGLTFVAQTPLR